MSARERGFTLIEIIFVVFIIGMAVSVISISVGGNSFAERTKKAAETFMLQASYVAEQSVLKGETHGLFVELRPAQDIDATEQWCYTWMRIRDSQWQAVPELPQSCLDEGLVIEFRLEDELWEYDPELEIQEPVLGFFPSGDASAMVEISLFPDHTQSDDEEETQLFELEITGELRWINEEKRLEEEQRGR